MGAKNKRVATSPLGASNHSLKNRELNDYYATDPDAVKALLSVEKFDNNIWEPACGEGHISNVLTEYGYNVKSTDLIDRGYGIGGIDFFTCQAGEWDGDIITNPPYSLALEFVKHSLQILPKGRRVTVLLRLLFLEGQGRRPLFDNNPPSYVYVFSKRVSCYPNGDFSVKSGAVAYAWFVFEVGYTGDTIVRWL